MASLLRNVSVLVVDDHPRTRRTVGNLLELRGMRVVGEATDGCEAVRLCAQLRPQVVVLDISMPLVNGLGAARQIAKLSPDSKMVFLTAHTAEQYAREAFRVGGLGFVAKNHALRDLPEAVEAALQGRSYVSDSVGSLGSFQDRPDIPAA